MALKELNMNFVDYYFNVIQICPSAFVRGTPLQGLECDFKVRLGGSFLLVICLIFFFLKVNLHDENCELSALSVPVSTCKCAATCQRGLSVTCLMSPW